MGAGFAPARAQGVDLLLVLAVDASGSVSTERFELQKQGYAAAFRDKRVQQAIAGGMQQRIGVAMVQWTGPRLQRLVVDWHLVDGRAAADALAGRIEAAPRQLFSGTSISGLLDYALGLLDRAPWPTRRKVIDITGDGGNNSGRPVGPARDDAVERGVTINGLPILNVEPYLAEHYRENVIGGPGAFMIAIDSYEQFADAIRRKLITEISGLPAPPRLAAR